MLRITELPVGKWTQDYKELLDNMLTGKSTKSGQENILKNYTEHHTGNACLILENFWIADSFSVRFRRLHLVGCLLGIGGGEYCLWMGLFCSQVSLVGTNMFPVADLTRSRMPRLPLGEFD